jgi:hypothetical protein
MSKALGSLIPAGRFWRASVVALLGPAAEALGGESIAAVWKLLAGVSASLALIDDLVVRVRRWSGCLRGALAPVTRVVETELQGGGQKL